MKLHPMRQKAMAQTSPSSIICLRGNLLKLFDFAFGCSHSDRIFEPAKDVEF
jgi:hypothetical protein